MLMAEFLWIGNEVFCQRAMNLAAQYQQSCSCSNEWLIVEFHLQRESIED
jgi:hypothetical protein